MTNDQLTTLLTTNRELIQRNHTHAIEHLQMLISDYGHIVSCEVSLNIALNASLVEVHFHSNYKSAIEISLQAIEKCKHTEQKNLIAQHYWLIGQCYINQAQYKLADEYLLLCSKTLVPGEGYLILKTDLLIAYAMKEEFENRGKGTAIKYLEEAILLLPDGKYAIRKASCHMGMGNVYINMGMVEDALKHYHLAAETYESFFDLVNMAGVYSNLGTCYIALKDYAKAEKFLQKSLELRAKSGSPDQMGISYINLAIVYSHIYKYQQALDCINKGTEIFKRTGNLHYLEGADELLEEILTGMAQLTTS